MKKFFLIVLGVLASACLVLLAFYLKEDKSNIESKSVNIEKYYSQYVSLNKECDIYKLENNEYVKYYTASSGNEYELEKLESYDDIQYFKIKDSDLYISYENLDKIDSLKEYSTRHTSYIPFNKNIKTNDEYTLTDEYNNTIKFYEASDFTIIINDTDKYGISYNDRLYYINKDDVSSEYDNKNTDEKIKEKITTLTYHFIYDPEEQTCNQIICHTLSQFESHLNYFKENNYLTLKLEELEMFLDGKINLPVNSVVITIDDGTMVNEKAIDLLEQYQEYATLFVITGKVKDLTKFESEYLALESHTDNMHNQYECKSGLQGGGILCNSKEYILNDLKTSQEKLGGSTYFSYPFFDVNDHAIECLKEAGFTMAFVGQSNTNGKSWPGINKYKVPRKTISSITTMKEFISYVE